MPHNETSGFGPHEVTMPQLGMAQDAGKIVTWLKAPGDKVAKGDALFEVETDKATMEVEAQASGFLTHVSAQAGEDVPVGKAIARISESAEAEATSAPAPTDDLPEGRQITMPQLGMAQDSGVIVGWLVEPGAEVDADAMLFEVETDKATMEVPAGVSGYLAATMAQKGDDVPVGQVVAIISFAPPTTPVTRAFAKATAKPVAQPAPAPSAPAPAPAVAKAPHARPATASGISGLEGRILASPKLRRVALERGLDLGQLVKAGQPQPYHMANLAQLEELARKTPISAHAMAAPSLRLEADLPQEGFTAFADWAAEERGLDDPDALLAGLAGTSLGVPCVVAIERFGTQRSFAVPEARKLTAVQETEDAPDLMLRDLRPSPLTGLALGAEAQPVLSLLRKGAGLALVLEGDPAHLPPSRAIALLSDFAGRLQDPLRHLL
ncbi:MAG: pyruvate dehydrogenase [Rhodobacteraceae bacterium]|nr:MAG: pyruvate dehydrogenase [Paracoccaceae bacterium]